MGSARPILVEVDEGPPMRVTFRLDDRIVVGESDPAAQADPFTAAATAAVRAIDDLVPTAASLELVWAMTVAPEAASVPVAVVLVELDVLGVPMVIAGTAPVRDRPAEAAGRAVADALNRRLEILGIAD